MKLPVDTSNSNAARPIALTPKILVQDMSRAQNETRVPMLGAEQGARKAMLQGRPSQQETIIRPRKRSGEIPVTQRLSLGSVNVIRDPAQKSQRNGAGITRMCARRGDGENLGYLEHKGGSQVGSMAEIQPLAPTEIVFNGNGGVWFAGQWAEAVQAQGRLDSVGLEQKAALKWRLAMFGKAADVKLWLYAMEGRFQASAKLNCIRQRLHQMACHAIRTLHPTSPALIVRRTPNVSTQDYLEAAKDVILACVYGLVLLNALMALRKVLVALIVLLYWVWNPVRIVLVIVKWCVLG